MLRRLGRLFTLTLPNPQPKGKECYLRRSAARAVACNLGNGEKRI
jgi:hypothetical protein